MLPSGLIRTSHSPYAAPVILREKINGEWRFITDFSYINDLTITDSFPMVKIQDILKNAQSVYISTLDAAKGYWQVPVQEGSKVYTAFRTRTGLYEYNVMPFGLKNSPATYQRIMNDLLGEYYSFCLVYQDDIIVFSRSFKDHINHLEQIFKILEQAGITLARHKCTFGAQTVKFLGHIVSTNGIKMNPAKVDAVQAYPQPKTRKELRKFLGVVNFYHHFIDKIGEKAAPLYELCSTKRRFNWTQTQQEAFETLKKAICNELELNYPDFNKPFILRTDASNYEVSGKLSQTDHFGNERVISFASKTLNSAPKNYSTVEKELYAIVFSLNKFYLYLDAQDFSIETNSQALTYLSFIKNTSQHLMRWA